MKKWRVLAWITFLLTFAAMIAAVLRFQEETEPFSNIVSYSYTGDWSTVRLDGAGQGERSPEGIREQVSDALFSEDGKTAEFPFAGESAPGDLVVFRTKVLEPDRGLIMRFATADAAVCVFLDGSLVYQDGFDTEGAPGERKHMVSVPESAGSGELWLVLTSRLADAAAALAGVEFSGQESISITVLGNSVTDMGCCLVIVLTAFLMFVLALIRQYTHQLVRGELYLGFLGVAAAVRCFIATGTLEIVYKLPEAYVMREYLALMVLLFLVVYFSCSLGARYERRYGVLLPCVLLCVLALLFSDVFGIRSLEESALLSVLLTGAVCAVNLAGLVQFYYSCRYRQTLYAAVGVAALTVGVAADSDIVYQYGMTAFCVIMAAVHIVQLAREYRENVEKNARLLEEEIRLAEQQNMLLALAKQDAEAARQEAQAANESKGKFLAHMSHEIRTPINAVLGMNEMILRESKEAGIREYAMDISAAGQTLLSLINDILDFSKIESGKMEIVPVTYDVGSMVHDLENMAVQRAKNKNIRFEAEVDAAIPSQLYGDDVRIRQVLTNILTNAVKYTHEGNVWLRVKGFCEGGEAVLTFEVEDTGIGIRKEDLPKLTAEFERIEEDRNRNIEGTGLGMSITIQLLELLGSRLRVASTYGKGSTFSFELRQRIVDQTPVGDYRSRVQQSAQDYCYGPKFLAPDAKILVTDDNEMNRRVFRALLKETQIQVTEACSGMECLELVQKYHYDLIFLDHMMPEMDGVETLHRIRALSDFPCEGTPVVVLTANAVSGAREQYLAEGFDDFLSKPIVPDRLERMAEQMLPQELLKEAGQRARKEQEGLWEELPAVDGLDWQYAFMHLSDRSLVEYTVREFYAQIDSAAERLEKAWHQAAETGQTESYRIQVHAMKGLLATVGILSLSGVARLLESAARDVNLQVIEAVTPVFLFEWRSYREKLRGVFGVGEIALQPIADVSVVLAQLDMLLFCVQEADIDRADELMAQLLSYGYPNEAKQTVERLAAAVTDLDAGETEACVKILMEQLLQWNGGLQ